MIPGAGITVGAMYNDVNAWLAIESPPQPTLPFDQVLGMINAVRRKIVRRRPRLECLEAVTVETLGVGQRALALPTDHKLLMKVEVLDADSQVVCSPEQRDHDMMLQRWPHADVTIPADYIVSVWGGYLWCNWTADAATSVKLWYYRAAATLTSSNSTDALMDEAYDCILDGVLARAVAFGFEEERSAYFKAEFVEQLQELHDSNQRRRTGDRMVTASVPG